jgi:hypothetical protein
MKKRKSHRSQSRFVAEDKYSPSTYLRLCHRCLFLNEGSKDIEKCSRCESHFAEFSSTNPAEYKNVDFGSEEDPIQEAIVDFEAETVKGAEDESSEASSTKDSDEDDESEEGQREQKKRGTPISGLSVLW